MNDNVNVVRRLYRAIAERDLEGAQRCFAPDAVWYLPGTGAIAGAHRGWPQIRDKFLARLGPLSGGSFRAELIDVAVGDQFVIAVQHATGDHNGHALDITGCQLMTVRDGLFQEVRGHYSDQAALDNFWQ